MHHDLQGRCVLGLHDALRQLIQTVFSDAILLMQRNDTAPHRHLAGRAAQLIPVHPHFCIRHFAFPLFGG